MADPQEYDQVAQANAAIRFFIRDLPGGRITPDARPEYERLVRVYFAAVRARDEARDGEQEPESLAA